MSLADYTLTFTGAGEQPVQLPRNARFIRIRAADSTVFLKIGSRSEIGREKGEQVNLGRVSDGVQNVMVRSEIAQTVKITVSEESQEDNRATLNAVVNATLEQGNENAHLPKVTIGAGATVVLAAANASRKSLRVALPSDAAGLITLGKIGVTATAGGLLEPGMVDYMDTEGELYAHNGNADPVDVYVMEVNRL